MKKDILDRLLRASSAAAPEKEMPFGFDTRVLALARSQPANGAIALLARRAAMLALAVIAVASIGAYQAAVSNNDLPAEYRIADTAIQNSLNE